MKSIKLALDESDIEALDAHVAAARAAGFSGANRTSLIRFACRSLKVGLLDDYVAAGAGAEDVGVSVNDGGRLRFDTTGLLDGQVEIDIASIIRMRDLVERVEEAAKSLDESVSRYRSAIEDAGEAAGRLARAVRAATGTLE